MKISPAKAMPHPQPHYESSQPTPANPFEKQEHVLPHVEPALPIEAEPIPEESIEERAIPLPNPAADNSQPRNNPFMQVSQTREVVAEEWYPQMENAPQFNETQLGGQRQQYSKAWADALGLPQNAEE